MTTTTSPTQLAIDGGTPAFQGMNGKAEPKVGTEEFLSIAERFGYSPQAIARIRAAVSDADLEGAGPNLARYACPFPPRTKAETYVERARAIFGVKHVMPVSSGTGALHAAMVGIGIRPGDEVIVPATGFVATAMAARLAGGKPVFCDIDDSMQIDPRKIEGCITPRTVAIAPTHFMGGVCDMDPILAVAKKHKLKVVEDCAQAPGGVYRGKRVGSIGDIGCFSISCYKIIGGGEGGMIISNDDAIFERASQLAEAGGLWRGKNRFAMPEHEGQIFVGTNYRASELESAVNVVQLAKLEGVVTRYRKASERIRRQILRCKEVSMQKFNDPGAIGYQFRLYPQNLALSEKLGKAMRAEGVSAGYRGPTAGPDWHVYDQMLPITLTDKHASYERGACPVADDLFARSISIGVNQWFSDDDCDRYAAGINKALAAYCTVVKG